MKDEFYIDADEWVPMLKKVKEEAIDLTIEKLKQGKLKKMLF